MARLYTRLELRRRARAHDAVVIIDNVAYDVSGFLDEHPGGADVLLGAAGGDATECFRRVGHSEDALRRRARLRLGELVEEDRWPDPPAPAQPPPEPDEAPRAAGLLLLDVCGPPLLLAALAALVYVYLLN